MRFPLLLWTCLLIVTGALLVHGQRPVSAYCWEEEPSGEGQMTKFDSFTVVNLCRCPISHHQKELGEKPYQEGFGIASQEFWVSLSREKTMKNKVILSGSFGKSSVQYDSNSCLHISSASRRLKQT